MSYYDLLNDFYDLLQSNPLSSSAQLLYYTLLQINNKCGWIEWFQRTNINICGLTRINEKTLISCRNELKQVGLINFISSKKKGDVTKYKILGCKIDGSKYSRSDSLNDSLTTVEMTVEPPDIKDLDKDIDKDKNTSSSLSTCNPKTGKEKNEEEEKISLVIKSYLDNISPTPSAIVYDEIKDWLSVVEPEVIIKAIEIAVMNNGRSLNYIKHIVDDWICKGLTSKILVNAYLKDWERKKKGDKVNDTSIKTEYSKVRITEL